MLPRLTVDFHCHSGYSKDSLTSIENLIQACMRRGVDRLVITDHNTIEGALLAQRQAPQLIIVGEEIMTTRGELLAAFVTEEVPAGLPPQEAIQRLRSQGAFISVSHPFDVMRHGHWALPDLLEISPRVDAVEVFNARCMQASFNQQALDYTRGHNLAGTAGSDAHGAIEVGKACLVLPPFTSANELRQVIRSGRVQGHLSSPLVHFISRYARFRKQFRV
jgi:predicted metal-dependent phosphoesterase TrpH